MILIFLAGVALPKYLKTAERSKDSEAYVHLGLIRTAEIDYYAEYNTFTDDIDLLNIDNPNLLPPPPVGTRLFTYAIQPPPPTNVFTGVATRQAGISTRIITIDHNGITTRTITP